MSRAVLVTGGAGYVGSHTCKALAIGGYEPITYDNLDRGHRELVKWGPLEEGDLVDRRRLDEVLKRYRPVAVMHFAALTYVAESVEQPDLYRRVNVEGSRMLLQAMADAGVRRIVFSSSAAIYGNPHGVPITEEHPKRPVNPYGQTKLDMEREIERWARDTAGKGVIFRYFNAAGADPEGETGEWHEPETHLIPLALAAAAGDLHELTIYGSDYDTPDGTCIRDYIHVTDLADAHLLGLEHSLGSGAVEAFNLGTGTGFSVDEVVRVTAEVTGRPVPHRHGPRRPGDPSRLVADASLATRTLGWSPRLSALPDIVRTAWQWHQRRK